MMANLLVLKRYIRVTMINLFTPSRGERAAHNMSAMYALSLWSGLCAANLACQGQEADFDSLAAQLTSRVSTPTVNNPRSDGLGEITHQRPHLKDAQNRYVHIKGLNVSGSHKAPPTETHGRSVDPAAPDGERHRPSRYPLLNIDRPECLGEMPIPDECLEVGPDGLPCTRSDTCTIDYVASPFPLEDSDRWFGQMASLGFNSVRLITNWESIQPYRPGSQKCLDDPRYTDECYDLEYIEYYEQLVAKAKEHGIYVLVDMHQDIFSRHIMTLYNESPTYVDEGATVDASGLDKIILSLFPPYTDWVRGHGAPRWVVQAALPEKKMGSEYWGMFRGLGQLTLRNGGVNVNLLTNIQSLLDRLAPGGEIPPWLPDILNNRPARRFEVNETSDILPLSPWILPGVLSLDVDRGFAALFAGDVAFPNLVVDDDGLTKRRKDAVNPNAPNLKEYLQGHYVNAFLQLAQRTKAYDNVIGYDVINEPVGAFLMMALGGVFRQVVGEPQTCTAPVHCLLPVGCDPSGDEWPTCLPAELIEDGETPEETYARLEAEAIRVFECIDDRGRDASDPEVDETLWCRNLGDQPATSNPLVLHGDRFEEVIINALGVDLGSEVYGLVRGLQLLPTDAHPYTMYQWGLSDIDTLTAITMNLGFEEKYLQPFYERVGQALQEEDPNAIIWFEPSTSIRMLTGPMRFWDQPLARPRGIKQLVYAPHWYPDIYPTPGINSPARSFNSDELLYRDFTEPLREHLNESPTWLGNIPVVFGEFGTYFNLRSEEEETTPEVSAELGAHVLNSYFESFEELNLGNMLWCFSATNSYEYGEDWNHEDFSIIDPQGEPRAWPAYVRTYARSTSGKVIHQRFNSQYHFWDPEEGKPNPTLDYELDMARRESDEATEIFVPQKLYSQGFYVWLSDGSAFYDLERQMLYWYPSQDELGVEHHLKLKAWRRDHEALGWSYFFKGDEVLVGVGDATLNGMRGVQ